MTISAGDSVSAEDEPSVPAPANAAARIDLFVEKHWEQQEVSPAPSATDRQFARRVYLDLAGRIPSVQELNTFLTDGRPEKRAALIELLLGSEDHVQHFADIFDTLLMGRGSDKDYESRSKHAWRSWLECVFRENRPWNTVVAEILRARPQSQDERGAVWFLYERNNKHQEIAESIAPAFFGVRIECAQCHDHMMAPEIEQAHYWGLVAFFNRGTNVQTPKGPRVKEAAIGGFSEFANLEGTSSPNLLAFLEAGTVKEPRPKPGKKEADSEDLYAASSVKGEPKVPNFSRRQRFVEDVASNHPRVARAFVNRIWAMLMGRGIVHPFDEMDSVHEPSHPELLDWLADDFRRSGYDIRRLVHSIVLTRAYQLSSRKLDGVEDPAGFAWYIERPLTAEQFARSAQLAVRGAFRNDDPLAAQVRQKLPNVLPDSYVATVSDALFLSNNNALNAFISESTQPDHLP